MNFTPFGKPLALFRISACLSGALRGSLKLGKFSLTRTEIIQRLGVQNHKYQDRAENEKTGSADRNFFKCTYRFWAGNEKIQGSADRDFLKLYLCVGIKLCGLELKIPKTRGFELKIPKSRDKVVLGSWFLFFLNPKPILFHFQSKTFMSTHKYIFKKYGFGLKINFRKCIWFGLKMYMCRHGGFELKMYLCEDFLMYLCEDMFMKTCSCRHGATRWILIFLMYLCEDMGVCKNHDPPSPDFFILKNHQASDFVYFQPESSMSTYKYISKKSRSTELHIFHFQPKTSMPTRKYMFRKITIR